MNLWIRSGLPLGICNMYRRAEPFVEGMEAITEDDDGNIIDPLLDGLDMTPWGDKKRSNLGWVDGKLVVIDYSMSS